MHVKQTLLYVEDRPSSLSRRVYERSDYNLIILRRHNISFSDEYLEQTKHIPSFYYDASVDAASEAERFLEWCNQNNYVPDRMLNPSEPEQFFAHAFARAIGIPALSEQQVIWLRNKYAMKEKFKELGFDTAEFVVVRTKQDILDFADTNGWPVVFKPQEGFATRNTYKLSSEDDVASLEFDAEGKWQVESYVKGQEWECCALVKDGKVLDTYLSYMPARPLEIVEGAINANVTIRPHPTDFPVDTNNMVQRIVDGMSLDHGYMHMEFFVDNENLYLGECALRFAGCEIPGNHGLACGFNMYDALIDIHLGREPNMEYMRQVCVGDLLLPVKAGLITEMTSRDELMEFPGVIDEKPRVKIGDYVQPQRASHICSTVVHVAGESLEQVLERMNFVRDNFKLEVFDKSTMHVPVLENRKGSSPS